MTALSPQQQFHAILSEMGETFDRKNKDYGQDSDPFANVRRSEQWGIPPWIGAMVRAGDKMTRLETFAQKGTLANEGVEDSLLDLAVYSIIALLLFREQEAELDNALGLGKGLTNTSTSANEGAWDWARDAYRPTYK